MLRHLASFELRYHFKQVSFRAAAILFVCLGMLIAQGNFGGSELHKNAPYVITYITSFLSLFVIFVSTLFCANVVLRDSAYDMEGLIFSSSLQRLPYFLIRLMGLLMAVFIVLSLALGGIFLGTFTADPDQLGAYQLSYFLQPLFVFGLPNVLFCSSIIFSVALLTRSMRAVYMTGVALFIFYFLGSILGNSPLMASSLKTNDPGLMPYLLDPFGISAFLTDTRAWTVTRRNTDLFPLQGAFLANRLLWTGLALGLLTISYRAFKFRLPTASTRRHKQETATAAKPLPYHPVSVYPTGLAYHWACFRTQLKLETASLFKHIPFLVMLALWIFLYALNLKEEVINGPYGIRFYAYTGSIVEEFITTRPALLLLIFYASELISRERTANMQGLVFSTPVSNASLWGAKCATLGVLIAILITANIGIGIGMQLYTGYTHIDWGTYLSLYYYNGLPLLLLAVLIVFIQTIVPNKFLGILFSLVVMLVIIFGSRLGIKHPLVRYATLPTLEYSLMDGLGHYTRAVRWYLLYWAAFAGILALLAMALWQGSAHTTLWQRMRTMGIQWGIRGKLALAVALLLCAGSGMYIYGNIQLISSARGTKQEASWMATYEKTYKPQAHLPQPYIIAIRDSVDLYPAEGKYTVQGHYRLRNESAQPIATIWLGVDPEVTTVRFSVPHARLEKADALYKQYFYTLQQPLLPGQEMELPFSMDVERSAFSPFNAEHSVVSNGSYIELEKYLPYLGYNDRFENGDPIVRKEQGLPPLIVVPPADSAYHRIEYETVVSTAADQQVVTVGTLQKEWTVNNRHYFHFKTEQPIAFMLALSSARYALQKETYKGIDFSIYYQPGQTQNLPTLLQGMKDAIDYGNDHFSPYPLKQLTLAWIPHYPGAATAYPGVVFSAERINFMSNLTDSTRFNNIYALTAHEVGHQWWANALSPLDVPGRGVLTESLAKYTEFMTAEKRYGKYYLRKLLQADNNLYFALRNMTSEQELPLAQTHQNFGYYQKGGLALYALKESLGEDSMNKALRQLLATNGYPHTKATTAQLIQQLQVVATPAQAKQVEEVFKQIIVYNNNVQVVRCDSLSNGQFKLQVKVHIEKADEAGGKSRNLVPDDRISIALYDTPANQWNKYTQPLYMAPHHFTQASTLLTLVVNKKPVVVAVDPLGYLLDADQEDNLQPIK
jgi:hypothetical protein